MEIPKMFRIEVGQLLSFGAVQRLQPEIIDAVFARGIYHALAILAEMQHPEAQTIKSLTVVWPESVSTKAIFSLCSPECSRVGNATSFVVGRNVESDCSRRHSLVRNDRWRTSIDGNPR